MSVMTTLASSKSSGSPTPSTPRSVRPGDRITPEAWLALGESDGYLDPDGEDRWEVIDGVLVVSAAPSELHQLMAQNLGDLLRRSAPAGTYALGLPTNLVLPGRHGFEPDVIVKRTSDFADHLAVPLLVGEVLSPSTRARDQREKRDGYAELGVPSYWLGDPHEPSLTVLELGAHGRYVEVRTLIGEESAVIDRPFPVRVCPADLVSLPGA